MSGEREGEHPARAYGTTAVGLPRARADPGQSEEEGK